MPSTCPIWMSPNHPRMGRSRVPLPRPRPGVQPLSPGDPCHDPARVPTAATGDLSLYLRRDRSLGRAVPTASPGAGDRGRPGTAVSGRPWRCSTGTWRWPHRIPPDTEAAKAGRGDVHTRAEGGGDRQALHGKPRQAGQYLGSAAKRWEGRFAKHRSPTTSIGPWEPERFRPQQAHQRFAQRLERRRLRAGSCGWKWLASAMAANHV